MATAKQILILSLALLFFPGLANTAASQTGRADDDQGINWPFVLQPSLSPAGLTQAIIRGESGTGGGAGVRRKQQTPEMYGPRFRFALTAAAGYSTTTGDWFEGISHGPAANATLRAAIAPFAYLGLGYRYQMLGVTPELDGDVSLEDADGFFVDGFAEWDITLQEYAFLLGFMTNPATYTLPMAYLELGVGVIYHDIALTFTEVGGVPELTETKESEFAFMTGVGAIIPLAKGLGLEFEGTMRITGDNNGSDYYGPKSTGYLWGANLGLAFLFGG